MSVSGLKKVFLFNAMGFLLVGCVFVASDPHENFRAHLNKSVGMSVDIEPIFSMCADSQKNRIGQMIMENGNIEYKHILRRKGICTYYCEVDPHIRKVLNVRYEGSREDCVIVP